MSKQDPLEAWLAQEREILARLEAGAGTGVARPEQVAGKSGLEIMQALLHGDLPGAPIARTLDFLLVEVGEGRAVFQGTPGPAHLNPMGTIHGGWYATLLDSALGCAVNTLMPAGRGYTTAELSVNLVRAIGPDLKTFQVTRRAPKARSCTAAASSPPPRAACTGRTAPCTRMPPPPAWCST